MIWNNYLMCRLQWSILFCSQYLPL